MERHCTFCGRLLAYAGERTIDGVWVFLVSCTHCEKSWYFKADSPETLYNLTDYYPPRDE